MNTILRCLLAVSSVTLLGGCSDLLAETVAFGDSVTFGYGGERGGWVSHLEEEEGHAIANFGVPGELVVNGRARFGGPIGPLVLAPNARRLLLLHGGNDIAKVFLDEDGCNAKCDPTETAHRLDELAAHVDDIVDRASAHGLEIFLATYWAVVPEVCEEKGGPHLSIEEAERANLHVEAYNARIVELADRRGVEIVRLDLVGLDERASNYWDCIHPSDDGYRILAKAWKASLDAAP